MSETLKVWAHNSSHNPIDEHQKQHADDTLMLIAERDKLKAEVELQIDDRHKLQKELNAMENEHFNETNKLKRALEREREANAKLREALEEIDDLSIHDSVVDACDIAKQALLAAKQDETN